jgi:hypothetical protein
MDLLLFSVDQPDHGPQAGENHMFSGRFSNTVWNRTAWCGHLWIADHTEQILGGQPDIPFGHTAAGATKDF